MISAAVSSSSRKKGNNKIQIDLSDGISLGSNKLSSSAHQSSVIGSTTLAGGSTGQYFGGQMIS